MDSSFYDIGKFSLSYIIKSVSRGDAHSRERQMSAKAETAAVYKLDFTIIFKIYQQQMQIPRNNLLTITGNFCTISFKS